MKKPQKKNYGRAAMNDTNDIQAEIAASGSVYSSDDVDRVLGDQSAHVEIRSENEFPLAARILEPTTD